MRFLLERFMLAMALMLVALSVTAHHSTAMFDSGRDVTLEGVVSAFHWVNPHVHIEISVAQDDESITWTVEADSPRLMARSGWSANSLARGDHVVISATTARNPGSMTALLRSITKADGTRLGMDRDPGGFHAEVRLTGTRESCPRVDLTSVESGSTAETRPVQVGNETIFVSRNAFATTTDITEIRVSGDEALASIHIDYSPEAAARLFDATTDRDGLRIAFVVDDEVWLSFTWEGSYGIGPGGTQLSLRNGMALAQELVESIRMCTGEQQTR